MHARITLTALAAISTSSIGPVQAQQPLGEQLVIINSPAPDYRGRFGRNVLWAGSRMYACMERGPYHSPLRRGGVIAYDMTNPAEPLELWSVASPRTMRTVSGSPSAFGWSMASGEDVLVVGAMRTNLHEPWDMPNAGAVFLIDPDTGGMIGEIPAPLQRTGARWFGYSVAIEGDRLLVGMPGSFEVSLHGGAAYLYDISDPSHPALVHKFLPEQGTPAYSSFGASVAIQGDAVVVADWQDYKFGGYRSGEVHVFDAVTGERRGVLLPEPDTGNDMFANSIAINDGLIAVTAPADELRGPLHWGAIYLFDEHTLDLIRVIRDDPRERFDVGWGIEFRDGLLLSAPNSGYRGLIGTTAWDVSSPTHPIPVFRGLDDPFATGPGRFSSGYMPYGNPSYDGVEIDEGRMKVLPAGPCSKADFVRPFGVVNTFDIAEFLGAMARGELLRTDLADPIGTLDMHDVLEYLAAFNRGCPTP